MRHFPPKLVRPQVHLDGELTHTHESYSGSTFNTLGVVGTEVTTVMLESTGLLSDEWISLIEVRGQFGESDWLCLMHTVIDCSVTRSCATKVLT